MSLGGADYRTLILVHTGLLGNAPAMAHLDLIWDQYAAKGLIDPQLQFLYVERDMIGLRLGMPIDPDDPNSPSLLQARDWADADGVSQKDSQILANLLKLREDVQQEIARVEAMGAALLAPAGAEMTTPAPLSGLPGRADPNDRRYRGDAVLRNPWPF